MQVSGGASALPSRRKAMAGMALGAGAVAAAAGLVRAAPAGAATASTPDWVNVLSYSAGPTGAADSTAAITAAMAAATSGSTPVRVVYFPAGNYKITSTLQLPGGDLVLRGDGQTSVINQSVSGQGALAAGGISFLVIEGLSFNGVGGSGSGAPVHGITLGTTTATAVCCTFTAVTVNGFQGDGINITGPVLCTFRQVNSSLNAGGTIVVNGKPTVVPGNGFTFTGQGTSVTMDSCYAYANTGNGYALTSMNYCSLNGCAADSNSQGYVLTGCTGVALTGCGAEGPPTENAFVLTSGTSNTLLSCYMYEIAGTGVSISGGEKGVTVTAVSFHLHVTPTTFVSVASGCVAALLNCITDQTTTALSLAGNTTTILCDGGNELSVAGVSYLATTNIYGPVSTPEGTNARMGTATLNGTTAVTVSTTAVTSKTRIYLTTQTPSGTPGAPYVASITAGSRFTVKSTSSSDKSVVAWLMIDHT